jgi:hypothetical protein
MRKLIKVCVALSVLVTALQAERSSAQGRGGRRGGGQQGMRGQGSQFGLGLQSGAAQGQMMQNRYRWGQYGSGNRNGSMQQGRLRNGSGSQPYGRGQQGQQRGRGGSGQSGSVRGGNVTITNGPLSQPETEHLLLMREEEKLARDVYLALGQKWNTPVFANIARSETRHMAAIKGLLDRYGLQDPVVEDAPGKFTNPKLAQIYEELVQTGMVSAADAYRVGVQIEELDIADLKEGLAATTHGDIRMVYQNLIQASQNHLQAFSR